MSQERNTSVYRFVYTRVQCCFRSSAGSSIRGPGLASLGSRTLLGSNTERSGGAATYGRKSASTVKHSPTSLAAASNKFSGGKLNIAKIVLSIPLKLAFACATQPGFTNGL